MTAPRHILAAQAAAVGAVAGCLGTWFEMSHGVFCIPVLTLPPLGLSQQVAVGSTVFGVAARQMLSATLYALQPGTELTDLDALERIIDVRTAAVLAASGSVTALGAATLTARIGNKAYGRCNGVLLLGLAVFLNWRDNWARVAAQWAEAQEQREQGEQGEQVPQKPAAPTPSKAAYQSLRDADEGAKSDLSRLVALGAASGAVIGFFGIGPAWLLAPVLAYTDPKREQAEFAQPMDLIGFTGADERTRLTACFGMVPPCVLAAFRHLTLGNVPQVGAVALPLAGGAILGSYIGGQELSDVECTEDDRWCLQLALFGAGTWMFFKPFFRG